MSKITNQLREKVSHQLDTLEMAAFNEGFEAAMDAIDELSNQLHNEGNTVGAETLRWTARELRGENC